MHFQHFHYFCGMKTEQIENIVFDFGNVLLDLDIPRTFSSFDHYLGSDFRVRLAQIYPSGDIFDDFEVGLISETQFLDALRATAATPVSLRTLRECWNAMLLKIEPNRLDFLLELRKKYRVFLLSNTNSTHLEWVDGYLRVVFGFDIETFNKKYFDHAYYSHEIGRRKPNRNIFDFVATDANFLPQTAVFYDDVAQNVEAARGAGWNAVLHPVGAPIEKDTLLNQLLG